MFGSAPVPESAPVPTVFKAASAAAVAAPSMVSPAADVSLVEGGTTKKEFVEAQYDNEVDDDEELSFRVGDRIEVLEKDDSGWYRGRLNGREGLFPVNYVKLV